MRFRFWIILAAAFFAAGIGCGILIHNHAPSGVSDYFSNEVNSLGGIAVSINAFSFSTMIFIFLKNTIALGISFLFSPLLCLVPVLTLLFNSTLLSYIGADVVEQKSLGFLLAGILPHGVLEIPAFIMGEAAALSFGVAALVALFTRNRGKRLLPAFKMSMKYLLISFGILLPAAVIETFVTPLLIS
jgi:stage II sporulation protein M